MNEKMPSSTPDNANQPPRPRAEGFQSWGVEQTPAETPEAEEQQPEVTPPPSTGETVGQKYNSKTGEWEPIIRQNGEANDEVHLKSSYEAALERHGDNKAETDQKAGAEKNTDGTETPEGTPEETDVEDQEGGTETPEGTPEETPEQNEENQAETATPTTPESDESKESWWKRINKEDAWEMTKPWVSAGASVLGVKGFYDVPAYFNQRFMLRGAFGKSSLATATSGLLEANAEQRAQTERFREINEEGTSHFETRGEIYKQIKALEKDGKTDTDEFRRLEQALDVNQPTRVREAIEDVNKRLSKAKEGEVKNSKARNEMARILKEQRKAERIDREQVDKEITSLLDNYTTQKVDGMTAAKEGLRSALIGSNAVVIAGLSSLALDAVGFSKNVYETAKKEGKEFSPELLQQKFAEATRENWQKLRGVDETGEKSRARIWVDGMSAAAKFARIGALAGTLGFNQEGFREGISNEIEKISEMSLDKIPANFGDYFSKWGERMESLGKSSLSLFGEDGEVAEAVSETAANGGGSAGGGGATPETAQGAPMAENIERVGTDEPVNPTGEAAANENNLVPQLEAELTKGPEGDESEKDFIERTLDKFPELSALREKAFTEINELKEKAGIVPESEDLVFGPKSIEDVSPVGTEADTAPDLSERNIGDWEEGKPTIPADSEQGEELLEQREGMELEDDPKTRWAILRDDDETPEPAANNEAPEIDQDNLKATELDQAATAEQPASEAEEHGEYKWYDNIEDNEAQGEPGEEKLGSFHDSPDDNITALAKEINETPEYKVQPGDNIWKIIENKLEAHDLFKGMEEGQKTHLIDELKDRVTAMSPEELKEFGISSGDPNLIQVGEELDFSQIMGEESVAEAFLNALELSDAQIESIESYEPPETAAAEAAANSAAETVDPFPQEGAPTIPADSPHAEMLMDQTEEFGQDTFAEESQEALRQTADLKAAYMAEDKIEELYGSEGIFESGIMGKKGVDSLDWSDITSGLKDKEVFEVINKENFPTDDIFGDTIEPIGIDSEDAVNKIKQTFEELEAETGLKPSEGETVDDYLYRLMQERALS